jgi:hypothetical protein
MFTLSTDHLSELCRLNLFTYETDQMSFFGMRGLTPVDPDGFEFRREHPMVLSDIDYLHPRCSVLQWWPQRQEFAVFPGSTVPHRKYVKSAMEHSGQGANQLMTGCYRDYRKGMHRAGKSTGHDAFRQTNAHPIRRTGDDFDFDNDDRVEFVNPFDNIHAGWSMGVDHDSYASAGCQVIVGYPRCDKRGVKPDAGAWKTFKQNAYEIGQQAFGYVLLEGRSALRIASRGSANMVRLRYGSAGVLVQTVQQALAAGGFYEGNTDADFGPRMLRAVLEFQESEFGPSAADGIVGAMTAGALEIEWPTQVD